jgi:hypothetical protein
MEETTAEIAEDLVLRVIPGTWWALSQTEHV